MKRSIAVFILLIALIFGAVQTAVAETSNQAGNQVYYVAAGDTLDSIAVQFGVSAASIMRQNGLTNPDFIYVGQVLIIPNFGQSSGSHNWGQQPGFGCQTSHIVRAGETLSGIAWMYGTTIYDLLQTNNLHNKDFVYVGQKLCIPGSSGSGHWNNNWDNNSFGYSSGSHQANAYYHTVTSGETLSGLAQIYNVNYWNIAQANGLTSMTYITPGQQLMIPGYHASDVSSNYHKPYRDDQKKPKHYRPKKKKDKKTTVKKDKIYLRLGRNVIYEPWGRPRLGLTDCFANLFDDGDPVQRFTVQVIATNKSDDSIPSGWASNVKLHLLSGGSRVACKHNLNEDQRRVLESASVQDYSFAEGNYPGELGVGQTANVTYFTHLEKGDLVTKIEFSDFDICFEPNSGDRIACK